MLYTMMRIILVKQKIEENSSAHDGMDMKDMINI
jgi:hypothetical protein